jgi:cysteine desulfurase
LHSLGFEAEKELKRSRQVIAHKLGVQEKEIVFTSSGTEANNLAMFGFLQANPRAGKHILISAIEHPSVLEPAKVLAKMGYEVEFLKTGRNGIIDLNYLESCLSPDISFVSVMQVNNETGAIQPVEEIGKLIEKKAPGAVFHCDGVQGFGKIFLPDLPFKMYTASAHKIHGPRGAAFLYVKNGIKISPLLYGGGQESNLRSGTENLPAIAGFRAAVELAYESNELEYITTLNKYFRKELLKKIPKTFIISDKRVSSPYIIALSLPGTKAEVIQHMLESKNVFVSVGSACSSHKKGKSHVLLEMGLEGKVIDGAIRVSFSKFNTYDQLDYTINCMTEAVEKFSGV